MSALEIFNYQDHVMRTASVDGEPWFVASDVSQILGYRMASDMTRIMDADTKGTQTVRTPGGEQSVAIISEPGLYDVILRREAGYIKNPEARAGVKKFQRWITHEVLPSLRKTGSYSVAPALPQSYSEALRELIANVEAKEQAEARAKELEAPAQAWDVMVSANGDYAVDEAAKILSRDPEIEIGRTRLFTFMQELGWIYRQGARRNWHAYQSQVDNGRIKLRMTAAFLNAKTGEMENPAPTIRVTAKGLEALRAKLVPTRELVDA